MVQRVILVFNDELDEELELNDSNLDKRSIRSCSCTTGYPRGGEKFGQDKEVVEMALEHEQFPLEQS